MEISATSFRSLLQTISKAVSVKESATDYDGLLRKIFEERDLYVTAVEKPEMQRLNFPSDKVFGRDHEKKMLLSEAIGAVKKQNQLCVIPILGDCGMGKTTLARLVYEDVVAKKHFELQVWVKVDRQEFRLQHVAQEILKSTIGMSCSLADELDELDEMVRDTLQSQRCLIVFDGIESMARDSWLHMNQYWFDCMDLGSTVLITTPSKDVADLVANQPFELTQLSPDDSWSLAFESSDGMKDMSSTMARNLAALCRGIPLTLKLAGNLMRYDDKLRDLLSSVDFSDGILLPPSYASVIILLCIWCLPPHLRLCLAYCAISPKGLTLSKEKIIDTWIAHGLVKLSPGNNSLRDIGDSYFRQLLCMSFFTDITCNQYGDITEFRLPGLIYEIAHDPAGIFWKGKLGVIGSIGEDAGQISLVSPFEGKYSSEHLQALVLSSTVCFGGSNLDHSLIEFKDLQSLDLSCSGIRNFPDDICTLKKLRHLSLSYTLIETLPDSIANLSGLQTLDLSWCYHLKVLPKGLCNLAHMNHLDLSLCESLSCLPSGIGLLISLSSMPLFVLSKDRGCAGLGELRLLNQLRGRLEIKNLENVKEISEARRAMLDQKCLDHLGLCWSQTAGDCFELLDLLEPNPRLRVLELTGYMGSKFPRWMQSIYGLIKISMSYCGCKELPSLGKLPLLKELQLKGMTNVEFIGKEFYGSGHGNAFPSLEQLGFYDMPRLLEWSSAGPASRSGRRSVLCFFHSLKTLTIEGCPKLASLPSLPNLFDFIVWNSNYLTISSLNGFSSLSSLLIKDMGLRISFVGLSRLRLLKKLVLFNVNDLDTSYLSIRELTALKHLGILHCHQLRDIILHDLVTLQKLHIVDCRNLVRILFVPEATTLIELMVEDCPKIHYSSINIHSPCFPRKLIIRSSDRFLMDAKDFQKLQLDHLAIDGCPWLERQLEMNPSLISHIPCVVLRNRKANYKVSQDSGEVQTSASSESKHNPRRKLFKDTERTLPTVVNDLFPIHV